jgi:hypothetical protein
LCVDGWVAGWVGGVEADVGGADVGGVGDAVEDPVAGVEPGGDAVTVGVVGVVAVEGDVTGALAPVRADDAQPATTSPASIIPALNAICLAAIVHLASDRRFG